MSEQRRAINATQRRVASVTTFGRYRHCLLRRATSGLLLLGLVWIVLATVWLVGTPLKITAVTILAFLTNRLTLRGIRRTSDRLAHVNLPGVFVSGRLADRSRQQADAMGAMLRSVASALIFGVGWIIVLDVIGVSVIPIIASLGIVGLAISFGAQSLIADLISGVMLIIDDQLGVGDRVDVGAVEGVVKRVTLQSTVILASVQLGVPHASDLRTVASLLQVAVELPDFQMDVNIRNVAL
jgi:small-conductance mechanosensitive channel